MTILKIVRLSQKENIIKTVTLQELKLSEEKYNRSRHNMREFRFSIMNDMYIMNVFNQV